MSNFDELVDMVRKSAISLLIYPHSNADIDQKFALELGVALIVGHPMVLIAPAGARVSEKLVSVCDRIVELDRENAEATGAGVREAITELLGQKK